MKRLLALLGALVLVSACETMSEDEEQGGGERVDVQDTDTAPVKAS